MSGCVAQSGLDPKLLEFENSVIVRANVTASGEQELIILLSAPKFVTQGSGESRFDGGVDRCNLERRENRRRGG